MRILLGLLLCLPTLGCKSIERLLRNSPFQEIASSADRINLWPLYYTNGDRTAVLWPVFDTDEKGFALRPLITRDGTSWELLPPLCSWNTETGNWVFLPAYSVNENFGLFPLFGSGWAYHVGPIWWDYDGDDGLDSGGVLPIIKIGDGFNYIGPVWWRHIHGKGGAGFTTFGLFPLFGLAESFTNIGPAVWSYTEEGELRFVYGVPLFGYRVQDDGSGEFITLLGGRGWDENGETSYLNVLGPVFHYSRDGEATAMAVAWPLFTRVNGPRYQGWNLWPLVGHGTRFDSKGELTGVETSALAGLYRHSSKDDLDAIRLLPLFSYRDENGAPEEWYESLSLYGHKQYRDGATAVHIGTPMLFNYRGDDGGSRWNALLGTISYETRGDKSEFNLLYYLYRQRTEGTETRRDFFPFFTWDSGEKHSGFSFLWRLFDWQRDGDRVSGHIFFIPWGDR